jgi:hypothetical protein
VEKQTSRPARRRSDRVTARRGIVDVLEQQSTTIANLQRRIIELEAAAARTKAEHEQERRDMIAAHESAVSQVSRERLATLEQRIASLSDSYKCSEDFRRNAERTLARVLDRFHLEQARNRALAAVVADMKTANEQHLDTE